MTRRRPGAPIEPADDGLGDLQGIHERDNVRSQGGLLAVAERLVGQKMRRAEAALIRHDHAVACCRQRRRHVDVAVDVIWPAVQQDDGWAVRGTVLGVPHVEQAGVDLLEAGNEVRPALVGGAAGGVEEYAAAEVAATAATPSPVKIRAW
jgi:hypothetical protein